MSSLLRILVCAATIVVMSIAGTNKLRAQTSLQRVANGLSAGLFLTHAPGDTERVFMLEQNSGRIRVMNLGTGTVSEFMTISGLSTGGERGLLGLAFDPNYQTNGHFYTYSSHPGAGDHQSQIRRYTVTDPATSDTASTSTQFSIMSFRQPFSNHNGGWIGFNPAEDAPYLYIATGDGGSGGDPQNNAQDITGNRLGKMLRIDVSGDDFASTSANYAIPEDNPFFGTIGDDEIWSYGLRNPWRSSFDRETGDFWIGDVGQNAREEIDYEPFGTPGGRNYGWRVEEGFNCFDNSNTGGNPSCGDPSLIEPVHTYAHSGGSRSVTGGYVYHGSVAQYEGLYFFGDFERNDIWTLDPYANNMSASLKRRNTELPTDVGTFSGLSSFGEDANGELYLTSYFNGNVYRFSTSSQDAIWNGDDSVGTAGDGTSWGDGNNWTRGSSVDVGFVAKDNVIFASGSSNPSINLQTAQTIAAAEFQADYRLFGDQLVVLSGNLRVNAGVVGTLDSDVSAETSLASLRKRGAGRLNINGVASQMVVLEGTLGGNGSVATIRAYEGSRIAPGESIGTLTTSDYQQQAGATLEIEVATSAADQLLVNGDADIDGTLEVDGTAYAPATRGTVDEFVVLAANTVEGTFSAASYDGTAITAGGNEHVGDGLFVDLSYSGTEVRLTNYYALNGDANGDRIVDGIDFLAWNANKFAGGSDWTTGDFNGDGITDGEDFILWNANKFTSLIPPVPEPSSLALLVLALIGLRRLRS